ncbi:TPA: hypothetical protein ACH3X1_011600 [Trebouxia sp. C0004]
MRPGKKYCSVGKVLVIDKAGQLCQPAEQELKRKTFYAGPAHTQDLSDLTWHLSVMQDDGYFSQVQQMLRIGSAWQPNGSQSVRDLLKEGLSVALTGTFTLQRYKNATAGFMLEITGQGASWMSLQVQGKLSSIPTHVADPVVFKFATPFQEGCILKLKKTGDALGESDKEKAARCGPQELVQRLLRMSYNLSLQGTASSKVLDSKRLSSLGKDFLEDVDAIETFCRTAKTHMLPDRFKF